MSEERNDYLDLIESLSRTPDEVGALVGGLSRQTLIARKSPDEFSALESVCHLRDIEVEGYTVRINKILTEDKPTLPDIDGGRLAIERAYNDQNVAEALEAFAAARQQNVGVLNQVSKAQLKRTGILEGVGHITLGELLSMMSEHDESHLDELKRIGRLARLYAEGT